LRNRRVRRSADHLHAVWTLPPDDSDFSTRWRLIRGIWQRRFWEHLIRDEADYALHIEYCYINPLKHRLVTRVRDWPHSSFHRDVRAGIVPPDWAGDDEQSGEFGER
jgi:putative transposase